MPEIAEVSIIADELNKEYGRHDLYEVEFVGGRFIKPTFDRQQFMSMSFPLTKTAIQSKGKFLYFSMLDKNKINIHFFFGLGMTGFFGKQHKHSAIKFTFDNGEVFFNDQRRFGTFKQGNDKELTEKLDSLGWDPLHQPNLPSNLITNIRRNNHKPIGEFLLEQGIIVGIGNYLRAEILFAAKISPFRLISSLSDQELETICQYTISIVKAAYDQGGATIENYANIYGKAGEFSKSFKVYGKKTDPGNNEVKRVKDKNKRTIHWVPEVQI